MRKSGRKQAAEQREALERMAGVFKALGDPTRVKILNQLATSGRACCVCELTEPIGLSQPTISHHLKKLSEAGLLTREQRGTWAYYSIDSEAAATLRGLADLEGASR